MSTHPFAQYAQLLIALNLDYLTRPPELKGSPRDPWTAVEIMHLKHLYVQQASNEELERAFPKRSYDAIKNKACKLGIARGLLGRSGADGSSNRWRTPEN